MIKVVASIFILLSAALASPALRVNVTKSKFLFIKWANFTPALHTADKDTVSTSSASKWYVFANYYGKIQSGDLGVAIQYKFNDDKAYTSAATNGLCLGAHEVQANSVGVLTRRSCSARAPNAATHSGGTVQDSHLLPRSAFAQIVNRTAARLVGAERLSRSASLRRFELFDRAAGIRRCRIVDEVASDDVGGAGVERDRAAP